MRATGNLPPDQIPSMDESCAPALVELPEVEVAEEPPASDDVEMDTPVLNANVSAHSSPVIRPPAKRTHRVVSSDEIEIVEGPQPIPSNKPANKRFRLLDHVYVPPRQVGPSQEVTYKGIDLSDHVLPEDSKIDPAILPTIEGKICEKCDIRMKKQAAKGKGPVSVVCEPLWHYHWGQGVMY